MSRAFLGLRRLTTHFRGGSEEEEPRWAAAVTAPSEQSARAEFQRRGFVVDWRSPIGCGSQGATYKATRGRSEVAVKETRIRAFTTDCAHPSSSSRARQLARIRASLRLEAETLRRCSGHAAVCSFQELVETDTAFYLVTELLAGGDLFDALVARRGKSLDVDDARALLARIACALRHMHDVAEVAHLDLKTENIVLARPGEYDDVRLVDFGSARCVAAGRASEDAFSASTPAYSAPEVVQACARLGPAQAQPQFDARKADIFSLGVVAYFVLTGTQPFDAANTADDDEVARRVKAGAEAVGAFNCRAWDQIPPDLRPIVRAALSPDPTSRPDAADLAIAFAA